MSDDPDYLYHSSRAQAERLAAEKAASDVARERHHALAERHEDRAWSIGEGHPRTA